MQDNVPANEIYIRFSVLHRVLHFVVMIGFTGLGITGLSLGFSSNALAKGVMWIMGGPAHAAILHRFLAVATYALAHGQQTYAVPIVILGMALLAGGTWLFVHRRSNKVEAAWSKVGTE